MNKVTLEFNAHQSNYSNRCVVVRIGDTHNGWTTRGQGFQAVRYFRRLFVEKTDGVNTWFESPFSYWQTAVLVSKILSSFEG